MTLVSFFMSAHLRAGPFLVPSAVEGAGEGVAGANKESGAVSRTEAAAATAVGCPQFVESAVLRALEDASRTRGGCFWHRISLLYRKSLFFAPNASEDASRTTGSLFEHGTHIPYRRSLFPVPSPLTQRHFSRPLFCRYIYSMV